MMENTAKLLDEIAKLKEKLHKHDKALARIGYRLATYPRSVNPQARETEKQTLEAVLRIFKEEEASQ